MTNRKLRVLNLPVLVLMLALGGASLPGQAAAGRTPLKGSVPPWAKAANYQGPADVNAPIGFRVYLGWKDPDGAAALARAVSDPQSPSYRKYLTPAQFRKQFSPAAKDVSKVQNWLRDQGFNLVHTPDNNHYVSAEGTIAQAQAAFGTAFGTYRVKGLDVCSPVAEVSVPDALAGLVVGVNGLDGSYEFVHTYHVVDKSAPPSDGFRNAPPLSSWWGQFTSPYTDPTGTALPVPWTVRGYLPSQIKSAYGIQGYDGAGQTVAVIDAYASPTILQDVNEWSDRHGLPRMTSSQLVQVVPPGVYRRPQNPKQDPQGWYGEETLDIEAVHGMAPAAKIVYVGAPNNYQDLDAAMNHVVDRHLAQIVTNSYGFSTELLAPGFIHALESTFVQAAIEGIGVYFSSGDDGDETANVGYATPDWPASSPWVTAVGGTALAVGADGGRLFETGWSTASYDADPGTLATTSTGWLYGSGGGESRLFARPWYQASLASTGRGVPDVAALGDPQTGMLVGQTQTFPEGVRYDEYRIGGTSLASPLFAGLMALADQKAGVPHGFANPTFYAHAGSFYDILPHKSSVARRNFVNGVDDSEGTVDKVRTLDDYSGSPTQHTAVGWDDVTGLGTPNGVFAQ